MRISTFLTIATIATGTLAQNASEIAANCPNKLIFNSTNVATLALCTTLNYLCPSPNPNRTQFETYNNTTGPAPSTCRPYAWDLALDANATGTLTIAGVATASNVWFAGLGPGLSPYNASVVIPAVPLKVTALELPDLVNVKGSLSLSEADRMEKFSVPLLEEIGIEGVDIDLSGTDPPAIDLSFPSFRGSKGFISLVGNIDSVGFPVLNFSTRTNITSTGNLDCLSFAASIVDTTPEGLNDAVICNSKRGSVTTPKAISTPTQTETSKSGADGQTRMAYDLVVVTAFISLFNLIL